MSFAFSAVLLAACIALSAPKPSEQKECPLAEHNLDAIEKAACTISGCLRTSCSAASTTAHFFLPTAFRLSPGLACATEADYL